MSLMVGNKSSEIQWYIPIPFWPHSSCPTSPSFPHTKGCFLTISPQGFSWQNITQLIFSVIFCTLLKSSEISICWKRRSIIHLIPHLRRQEIISVRGLGDTSIYKRKGLLFLWLPASFFLPPNPPLEVMAGHLFGWNKYCNGSSN